MSSISSNFSDSINKYFYIPRPDTRGIKTLVSDAFSWIYTPTAKAFVLPQREADFLILTNDLPQRLTVSQAELVAEIVTSNRYDRYKNSMCKVFCEVDAESVKRIIEIVLEHALVHDEDPHLEFLDLATLEKLKEPTKGDPQVVMTNKKYLKRGEVPLSSETPFQVMWGFRSKLFVVIERILELLLSIALKVTGTSKVGDSAQVRQLNLPDKILLTVAALLAIGQKIPILMEVPYAYSILTYGLIVAIVFLILSPVLAKLEDSIAPCPREFPGFKTIQLLSKEEVGYRPDMLRDLETNIKKGKVLLRGPRGSGKKDAFLAALLGLKEFNQGKLHFSYDCANLKEEELKAFVERAKRYKEGLVLYIESAHLGYESPAFQQIIETFPCVVLSSSGQVAKEPIFPGFKVMELQELGQDKTVKILRNLLKRKYPIETLSDELLITIYNESMRVNTGLANPEKSIHILEKFLESDRGSGTDRMAAKRVEWEDARISLIEALSFEEKHPEDEFAWVDGRVDDQWYADVDASIRSKQSAHVKIRVIDKALDRLQKEQEVILKPMEKLQKVHRDRLLCSERADAILRRFNPDDPNEQLIRRWIYLDILITKYDKIVVQCKEELQKLNILPVVTEEQIAVFVRTKYQLREGS